mmetsp:Transcript_29311/g.53008  ORF Transcript_29311/g.53008 Transcript_29311/m.53008 type:complete len:180 (+) Transcript_29311:639-1178(+)
MRITPSKPSNPKSPLSVAPPPAAAAPTCAEAPPTLPPVEDGVDDRWCPSDDDDGLLPVVAKPAIPPPPKPPSSPLPPPELPFSNGLLPPPSSSIPYKPPPPLAPLDCLDMDDTPNPAFPLDGNGELPGSPPPAPVALITDGGGAPGNAGKSSVVMLKFCPAFAPDDIANLYPDPPFSIC